MEYFVRKDSIVRSIWGNADIILFIFAGSAAEFALNKAVDWLYYTGRLPADPLGRLFSTVAYARKIIFAEQEAALRTIDNITNIHSAVEASRNAKIPDWAYRDVLFMLIDYSISSYELFERKLTGSEKEEVYNVFYRVGCRMGLKELPASYVEWLPIRAQHLSNDLERGHYTIDLFKQYRKHLGNARYFVLLEGQKLVVPGHVGNLLHFRKFSLLRPVLWGYKLARLFKFDWLLKEMILPAKYKKEIRALDIV